MVPVRALPQAEAVWPERILPATASSARRHLEPVLRGRFFSSALVSSIGKNLARLVNAVAPPIKRGLLFAVVAASWQPLPGAAEPLNIGSGVRIHAAPKSFKALRDQNVVRQRLDYSCGAAALSTLLTYGLDIEVTERELLDDLFDQLSASEVDVREKSGISLLDLQRLAQARGLRAQGFRIGPSDLARLTAPVIAFIQPEGYKHFVVFRGTSGDRVFLADPSRGNVRMPAYQFLRIWLDQNGTGVIFAVESPGAPARAATSVLSVSPGTPSQPELMGARELLAVGAASAKALR